MKIVKRTLALLVTVTYAVGPMWSQQMISPQSKTVPNVIIVLHSSQVMPIAMARFEKHFGVNACDCSLLREKDLTPERLLQAKVIFMQHPTIEMLERLRPAAKQALAHGLQIATDVPEFLELGWDAEPSVKLTTRLMPYFNNGGEENMFSFLLSMYQAAGGTLSEAIPPPIQIANTGIYHPDAPKIFSTMSEYLAWYRKAKPNQGEMVTVNTFYSYIKDRDTAVIDGLLRELEQQGMASAAVVGFPHASLAKIFDQPPTDPIRVMMMFTLALGKPEDRVLLEKQNVHIMNLMISQQTRAAWEAADKGITPDRINSSLSNPEAAGATEPIVVGTTEVGAKGIPPHLEPIPERVHAAVMRAHRWIVLHDKPNAEKKLAIIYYNNPPGKGNIGASYLNLAPSIRAVLETLKAAGYNTGERLPTTNEILAQLAKVGHNVENWEPGELDAIVRKGGAILVPVSQYDTWFAELPEKFRNAVNERWGKPEDAKLMAWTSPAGKKFFVIPGVQLGNIFLGPQLLRASFAEYTNVQHSATLPPHHGYVASFLYYRKTLGVDAMIQMGRHGTLEWLPGKNAGQAGWDTSEVLLGDLPNINYYIMDGDGEAIQARRRGAAVLISHLTPMLAKTGFEERFGTLNEALSRWTETHEAAPPLAAEYVKTASAEMDRLGLIKQLNLDMSKPDEAMEKAISFLDTIEESPLPLGLPTLGQLPSEDRMRAGLEAFVGNGFMPDESRLVAPYIRQWSDAVFEGRDIAVPSDLPEKTRSKSAASIAEARAWIANLRISPGRELDELPKVLHAEYLSSGPVGDPLNVPDGLPTGRDLHQGDPNMLPTRAAWELGQRMGDELLARYKKDHGGYPDHISMILWQGESGRTQGVMEAEALYLMGTQPEWNGRGAVDRVSLIPDAKLTHPRVNVVFTASGLYVDGLAEKIILLDRAARMAAAAGDNALSRQNRETVKTLMATGMSAEQATEYAGARVFSTAPGNYGFGLSNMVEQSRDVDEHQTMADLYLAKMNYVYTEKNWGTTVPKLLQNQLKGNQVVLHNVASNLYGAVDNDDVYQWMGGLRIASEGAGAYPELVINNLRHAGHEKVEGARDFIATELNARNWNPKWISEMQKEGYAGAREMTRAVEYLYGWKATAPETVSPEVWKKMYDVYVNDEYHLGVKKFMEKANPAARQALLGRLLEVDRQGTYKFAAKERQQMVEEYAHNVAKNGLACTANTCGNEKLKESINEQVRQLSPQRFRPSEQREFKRTVQRTTTVSKPSAAKPLHDSKADRSPALPNSLKGYRVTYVKVSEIVHSARQLVGEHFRMFLMIWFVSILGGVILGFARRRWLKHNFLQLMPKG